MESNPINHHYSRTSKLQKTPYNLFLIFSNANPFLGAKKASPSAPSIGTQGKQSCTGIFKGVERIDSNVEPLRLALIDPSSVDRETVEFLLGLPWLMGAPESPTRPGKHTNSELENGHL